MAEQLTLNQRVEGSSPSGLTTPHGAVASELRVFLQGTERPWRDARAIVDAMHERRGKPRLVTNPANDDVFAAYVETLVEHGAASTPDLERRLREVYPRATVHDRALAGERLVVWYVYREGHWVHSQTEQKGSEGNAESPRGPARDRGIDPD